MKGAVMISEKRVGLGQARRMDGAGSAVTRPSKESRVSGNVERESDSPIQGTPKREPDRGAPRDSQRGYRDGNRGEKGRADRNCFGGGCAGRWGAKKHEHRSMQKRKERRIRWWI